MITQAIRARELYHREKDYIVNAEGEVVIVDEFTGRSMPGRRYGEGLHQAIEAKEGVKIENENQTLATITYQNFFRLYDKFAGMTGTAKTEEKEFLDIYGSDVLVIPTNKPVIRVDSDDLIYRTRMGKYAAVVQEVQQMHASGRPILIGTASIETSEQLSALLQQAGVQHAVLNAKFEAQEASIIAQAGRSGTVTIATNMAGRGTDIMLGGNAEYIIGESIESQLGVSRRPRSKGSSRPSAAKTPTPSVWACRFPASPPTLSGRRRNSTAPPSKTASACATLADCTSSAPRGTSRAASTTSCAGVPGVRATPAAAAFTSASRTT